MVTKSTTLQISDTKPLVLPCVAHAHPPPEYRWWQVRGDEKLPLLTSSNSMGVPIGAGGGEGGGAQGWGRGGVVVLDPTRLELVDESTTLVCQASNEAGRTTMEVRIERSAKVTAHLSPRVLVVDAGAVGTLRCQVPGSHPHSISWYKDGHVLTPGGRIAITDGGSTLEVRSVGRGDSGMYQCFVSGSKETVQDASELRLGGE
ncbi:Down syndrome cell adhesion molecule-like protein Dscam2 [Penaeus monodon]|uniref:Down syndrome cell adhesion molecule-like protein Dscam2 n=1 Tax=Penaeus monodon TaxID=6687 RepID=UPI0018A7B62A|nr:Down syndrome cell adhesion molecule-like protein Dscam2 [Penaeus monodon]